MSHTPGPWTWFNYPDGRKLLAAGSRAVIHSPDSPMTCDADDARLIEAAPELLDLLRRIVVRDGLNDNQWFWLHDCKELLTRIDGDKP